MINFFVHSGIFPKRALSARYLHVRVSFYWRLSLYMVNAAHGVKGDSSLFKFFNDSSPKNRKQKWLSEIYWHSGRGKKANVD